MITPDQSPSIISYNLLHQPQMRQLTLQAFALATGFDPVKVVNHPERLDSPIIAQVLGAAGIVDPDTLPPSAHLPVALRNQPGA